MGPSVESGSETFLYGQKNCHSSRKLEIILSLNISLLLTFLSRWNVLQPRLQVGDESGSAVTHRACLSQTGRGQPEFLSLIIYSTRGGGGRIHAYLQRGL